MYKKKRKKWNIQKISLLLQQHAAFSLTHIFCNSLLVSFCFILSFWLIILYTNYALRVSSWKEQNPTVSECAHSASMGLRLGNPIGVWMHLHMMLDASLLLHSKISVHLNSHFRSLSTLNALNKIIDNQTVHHEYYPEIIFVDFCLLMADVITTTMLSENK